MHIQPITTNSLYFLIISRFSPALLIYSYCLPFVYCIEDLLKASIVFVFYLDIKYTGAVLWHMISTQANIIIYIQLPKTQNLPVNKVIYASWILGLTGRVLTSSVPSFSMHNWNPTGQCKVVAKIMDIGTRKPLFQSVFYCLLPVWPWTRHFSFLFPVSCLRVVVQIYSETAWKSVWCGVGGQCLVAIIVILWAH